MLHQLGLAETYMTCMLHAVLQDLSFSWPHHALIRHLHLGHLTALTRLGPKPLELALDCILPASLVELHAEDLLNSACLMPLQNLQVGVW